MNNSDEGKSFIILAPGWQEGHLKVTKENNISLYKLNLKATDMLLPKNALTTSIINEARVSNFFDTYYDFIQNSLSQWLIWNEQIKMLLCTLTVYSHPVPYRPNDAISFSSTEELCGLMN